MGSVIRSFANRKLYFLVPKVHPSLFWFRDMCLPEQQWTFSRHFPDMFWAGRHFWDQILIWEDKQNWLFAHLFRHSIITRNNPKTEENPLESARSTKSWSKLRSKPLKTCGLLEQVFGTISCETHPLFACKDTYLFWTSNNPESGIRA